MRRIAGIACAFAFCVIVSPALAGECTNPNALGTSRTLVIDNRSHPRLGSQQYSETLPLADHEVVLTFDDGPLGAYTTRILDLLAAECVKATYFLVGTMAQAEPALVRRIQKEGHTIGTHSRSHPFAMDKLPLANVEREIDGGIALVQAALGDQGQLAPFFRIPGLARSGPIEKELASRSLVTWSVDLVADDWHRRITADEIAKRALRRLDERGRGILLLHDIHPATALAMPAILKGLKARGFRVVHVVPAAPGRPKTVSEPQQWASYGGGKRSRVILAEGDINSTRDGIDTTRPVPSRLSLDLGMKAIAAFKPAPELRHAVAAAGGDLRMPRGIWTDEDRAVIPATITTEIDADAMHWSARERLAAIVSSEDTAWPAIQPPARAAERAKEPVKKAVARKKHVRPSTSCRGSDVPARCKTRVGHQLSLSGEISPGSLRTQYSF